ncbi:MAG: hypothetical protein CMN31_23790 [Sandaracinus sp.]|nr:hypothetical protein [Sandaracinus sp.]MBJ74311.1 hypothetical protein [Sandaracinus sp.]
MGPAAWAAVGRALGMALATSLFGGPNSITAIAAKQIKHAINRRDLELAAALLRDLSHRHRRAFEEFMDKYGADLPPEVLAELGVNR